MAKVFTITSGLENMGGLRTGGQGSVYKGRRTGEIITAVKILPTPIYSESGDDKNFTAFENEVAKLKKVNETPNPNVVKILSSGITDTGNFPFIEMEYIEGPDLEDLLKPPHSSIFTIKETLKVAEQLANALAHCHQMDVRHGDIKSNNVKFNTATGNYVLLDFGLAIMSDEQRRSSLRQAGAIEFMAPEQNTGQMLFQTDIYSFGIVLFELLAGTVPFQLKDKGESARNEVRLAHMVSPLPDVIELRRQLLPLEWDIQKQQSELQVPEWMVRMMYKCLEKKPQARFANGIDLYNYIIQKSISKPDNVKELNQIESLEQANQNLVITQQELKKQLSLYNEELIKKEEELNKLRSLLAAKEAALQSFKNSSTKNNRVSKSSLSVFFFFAFILGAFAVFYFYKNNSAANPNKISALQMNADTGRINANKEDAYKMQKPENESTTEQQSMKNDNSSDQDEDNQSNERSETRKEEKKIPQIIQNTFQEKTVQQKPIQQNTGTRKPENNNDKATQASETINKNDKTIAPGEIINKNDEITDSYENVAKKPEKQYEETADITPATNGVTKDYLITNRAYFYNEPDENTRRDEFISASEKAVVKAVNERYGFIYVSITNPQGRIFKGWLRKRDMKLYSIE